MLRVIAGVTIMMLIGAASAVAQGLAVGGTIKDASGGVLPGASVSVVVANQVVASAIADEGGRYQVQAPPRVPFQMRIHLDGFADQAIDVAGSTAAVTRDIVLQIGRVSDTLVVTSTRTPESLARVTQSVTVVTTRDIEALGGQSLADVMKTVPGVSVEAIGREGAQTSLFSRGGESDYNLVLIDGVRVNLSGGAFDFSRIAASEIERVEVVRGAQSALYGSDAMGAVVQVITKRATAADAPRVAGSIEGGSFRSFRGDARVAGGARQRVDYVAGVSARRTDGAFADLLPQDDEFDQGAFNGAVGASLGPRASVRTGVRYSSAQGSSVGQIGYGIRNTGSDYQTKDLNWYLNANHSAGTRYTGSASVNYFRANNESSDTGTDPVVNVYALLSGTIGAVFPEGPRLARLLTEAEYNSLLASPASVPPGQFLVSTPFGFGDFPFSSLTKFRRAAFKYSGDVLWGGGHRLTAGYEWERETNALLPEQELTNNAVFVQQQFGFADRWFATVGFRADDKSMYDAFFSPKLSAGGFLIPVRSGAVSSVKVFGNIGKGIKSPTFSERFGGSFADPSPDLKVERARSVDAGVEVTLADQRVRAGATAFNNHYRDQIEFRSTSPFFSPDGQPDFINIAGSNAHGVELEGALQRPVKGVTAIATYAYVATEVISSVSSDQQFQPGQPLLRRPKHSGVFRVGYERGPVSVNWDTRVVGQRHDSSFLSLATPSFTFTEISVNPRYSVSGFGAEYRPDRMASVYFRADNIFDEEYESALGFPGNPRRAVVGVRFNLGR
jgi:outer membrane cobalamin receptor